MSVFTGKISGAGAGLIAPGRWVASVTPVTVTDPAFIRGLEAQFTFNDLVINNLSYADRYRLSKIDGLYDADVRDSREANPSRHGETAYENYYSGRTIVFYGTIESGNLSKLRNMTFDLQQAFADITENSLYISYTGEYDTYISCKKYSSLDLSEIQDTRRPKRDFLLTLRASDPRYYSSQIQTVSISPTIDVLEGRTYNTIFNRDYSDYPQLDTVTITNNGNYFNLPDIKFIGAISNFVIINYTTGERLVVNTSLNSSDYYYYEQNTNSLVDSNGISRISSLDITSSNISLAPGDNIIGFDGYSHDSNAKVEIYAQDSWI